MSVSADAVFCSQAPSTDPFEAYSSKTCCHSHWLHDSEEGVCAGGIAEVTFWEMSSCDPVRFGWTCCHGMSGQLHQQCSVPASFPLTTMAPTPAPAHSLRGANQSQPEE